MRYGRFATLATLLWLGGLAGFASAQPTYKLDVKANLKPSATLKLAGDQVSRSNVQDDPGFRLQYHFKQDGKTVAAIEARSSATVPIPRIMAGT